MTKVGLVPADTVMGEDGTTRPIESFTASTRGKVPMVHCLTAPYGESGAVRLSDPMAYKTTRPNSADPC